MVTVVTSLLVPQGCAGVYYVRPGGEDGSYRAVGVAYYDHGRAVKRVSRAAMVGMHAAARATALSQGRGTYTFTESGPDAIGGVATFSGTTTFQWTNSYASARNPFELGALTEGENLTSGDLDRSTVTGVSSYTFSDPSNPPGDFSCQVPFSMPGQTYFEWSPGSHRKVMRFRERFGALPLDEHGLPPDDSDPSLWRSCEDAILPLDPSHSDVQTDLEIGFSHPLSAPSLAGDTLTWTPFTGVLTLHHHSRLTGSDPDSGPSTSEQDLSMTGTLRFLLRGVEPDG